MLPVFSNALSHRTHANMKRTGFDFTLWLSVVLFVAKIPAGVMATKSATDSQGKFLHNSKGDVKSVSSLIHVCCPAYVYSYKHTYTNSCWMTNHFLSLAEWTYNEKSFSYCHSCTHSSKYTRTHTHKHSILLNEEQFPVKQWKMYTVPPYGPNDNFYTSKTSYQLLVNSYSCKWTRWQEQDGCAVLWFFTRAVWSKITEQHKQCALRSSCIYRLKRQHSTAKWVHESIHTESQ